MLVQILVLISVVQGSLASQQVPFHANAAAKQPGPLKAEVRQGNMATASAQDAVLVKSVEMPEGSIKIKGYDFNQGVDHNALFDSFLSSGFQATNFGLAVEEIRKMRSWRLSDEPVKEDEQDELKDPEVRAEMKATIFLGYTSNMASCGVRESIRFLCQHKMVDCIVATAGGIEEDFIKCLAPTYLGSKYPPLPPLLSIARDTHPDQPSHTCARDASLSVITKNAS